MADKIEKFFNPFVPNALFLYPLKTSKSRKFFWCFQGVEKGCIANEWVKKHRFLWPKFHWIWEKYVRSSVVGEVSHSQRLLLQIWLYCLFLYQQCFKISFLSIKYACILLKAPSEAVVYRCCVEKVLLEISQNSLENTCAWVSFLINL